MRKVKVIFIQWWLLWGSDWGFWVIGFVMGYHWRDHTLAVVIATVLFWFLYHIRRAIVEDRLKELLRDD